jgi:hypothetical protein
LDWLVGLAWFGWLVWMVWFVLVGWLVGLVRWLVGGHFLLRDFGPYGTIIMMRVLVTVEEVW